MRKDSLLTRKKLEYEFNKKDSEVRKFFKSLIKIKPSDKKRIRKLKAEGFSHSELAMMYEVSVQKIAAITRENND